MKKSNLLIHTVIMTAVNLIMRSISVSFNAYLTEKIGTSGIGLFQLVMSVYSLAVTFSCAGIRLASTRLTVEINALRKNDISKSLTLCITYSGICGCIIGIILLFFSNLISNSWIDNPQTALPLKILALSLPFVAMSSALGGYFTATEKIPQYSIIQIFEQIFKIVIVINLIRKYSSLGAAYSCIAIVTGMTASEIFSFTLSLILKRLTTPQKSDMPTVNIFKILRISIPDAAGTCARNILLTVEHLLIPKGFIKSGVNSDIALSKYGTIHAMAMPVLLYPSAVLSSLSSLLVPDLAKRNEIGDINGIKASVKRNLKRTVIFSIICSVFFFIFALAISKAIYKTNEAAEYIRILSPLIPIMYTDIITDGMLKGLDQQIYSMRYNIIDSALCVILVYFLLPVYEIKGYIFILYISEIINFAFSINRLISVSELRYFQAPSAKISMFFRSKKYSDAHGEYGYQSYRGLMKRNQAP